MRTDLKNEGNSEKEPFLVNETLVWWHYPMFTKWKLVQRNYLDQVKDEHLIYGINVSTIIDSACFIEGTINYILHEVVYCKRFPHKDDFKSRLIDMIEDRLENSQWTDCVKVLEIVLGVDLKKEFDQKLWKGISALFTFRNMLVHGKLIAVEFHERKNNQCEIKVPKKYNSVFQYLLECKLIKNIYPVHLVDEIFPIKKTEVEVDIITNSTCDHFFEVSKAFIREILKLVSSSEKEDIEEHILDALKNGD